MKKAIALIALYILITAFIPTDKPLKIALLKYNGGGDWYANPTSLPNLAKYCNQNLNMNIETDIPTVEVGSADLFNYPLVHMTGHGNVLFNDQELDNLRAYLISGRGFLHTDSNYGMDKFIRPQLDKLFAKCKLVNLPFFSPRFSPKV
ncbi:MAG: DUF4159 domain-containing protein [Chitinophagales bacterium]